MSDNNVSYNQITYYTAYFVYKPGAASPEFAFSDLATLNHPLFNLVL